MKFRALIKASYVDLLLDAKDEEDAYNKVRDWMLDKNNRPFGGSFRSLEIRIRQPWKKQLKEKK
jgi:hypothetical protein